MKRLLIVLVLCVLLIGTASATTCVFLNITQGPQGVQGIQGIPGIQGEPGTTGSPGAKGDPGDQGIQGVPGEQGIQGIPGTANMTAGPQGENGDKGDAGSKGDQGIQGEQGIQGTPGAANMTAGPAGANGAAGAKGDTGDKGDKGDQGIQGIPGSSNGYALMAQGLSISTVNDAAIYVFGAAPKIPTTTTLGLNKVYYPKTGVIKAVELFGYSTTAGTNEAWPCYLVNTTSSGNTNLIQSITISATTRRWTNNTMNVPAVYGDYFEVRCNSPTWATNPAALIWSGSVYVE